MVRVYKIKKDYWFLKAGLFVVEATNGNFFITMDDQDAIDCPIRQPNSIYIDGNAVRADKEHFELAGEFRDYGAFKKKRKNFKNEFPR